MGRFFTPICLLGLLSACTAQVTSTSSPPPLIDRGANRAQGPIGVASERHQPELRYGRYTLVSTEPTPEQRDLLAQIIEVTIPSNLNPSVQDALHHVLQRSGYSLCPPTPSVQVLFTRPCRQPITGLAPSPCGAHCRCWPVRPGHSRSMKAVVRSASPNKQSISPPCR
jgi:type IV pili sensor histidine kinase/response regulator